MVLPLGASVLQKTEISGNKTVYFEDTFSTSESAQTDYMNEYLVSSCFHLFIIFSSIHLFILSYSVDCNMNPVAVNLPR